MGATVSAAKDVQYSVVLPGSEATAERTAIRRHYSCVDRITDNFASNPVKNVWELFQRGVGKSAEGPCLGTREKLADGKRGEYVWKTYREACVERLALEAGSGLLNADLVPLRKFDTCLGKVLGLRCIGIFAKNREEWIITEHACNAYGFTVVPLYDTLGPHSTRFILEETQMKTVVCDDDCLAKLLDALQQHRAEAPKEAEDPLPVKVIIALDDITEAQKEQAAKSNLELMSWDELLAKGRANMIPLCDAQQPTLETLSTICYTSGRSIRTTGDPKGVMMTHGNFVAAVSSSIEGPLKEPGLHLDASDCIISYLPLAHVYERFCENLVFTVGGRVGFYSGNTQKLLDDVQKLKPTVFCSVPRLFQRIEDRVTSSLQGKSYLARSLFQQALNAKTKRLRSSGVPQYALWDKIVFDKFRMLMGGQVRLMLTGSAPLDPHLLERMRAFFCCTIVEGYGLTETMGASFITWNVRDTNPGQVGGVLPCLEFCLLDVSETMGKYSITDEIPKGELCVRGSTVTVGYFKNPTETSSSLDKEGWLHTGDIAALLPNGSIQIIDRKKNIFKLAQGEYVAPEKIEAVYALSRFVAQCFVFGFSSENSLVAIIVPDEDQSVQWLKETRGSTGAAHPLSELVKIPELQQAIFEDLQQVGKKEGLKGFEMARKVHLHPEPFTVENNLLTPTFKLKRHLAKEVFEKEINEMYKEIHEEQHAT
ncbi:hypothetical protein Efla_005469 [Eimeria flavescens]